MLLYFLPSNYPFFVYTNKNQFKITFFEAEMINLSKKGVYLQRYLTSYFLNQDKEV